MEYEVQLEVVQRLCGVRILVHPRAREGRLRLIRLIIVIDVC